MLSYRGVKRATRVARTGHMSFGDGQYLLRRTVEMSKHAKLRKARRDRDKIRQETLEQVAAVEAEQRRRSSMS